MRRLRHPEPTEASLDISPLIDVVFLLLIFFMVTTSFTRDMKLDLERPSARAAVKADSRALRVYIDAQERVYIDEMPVKSWMIESRVREQLAGQAAPSVLVVTDQGVPAQTLVQVIDSCRLAGAGSVGVMTRQEEG